MAPMASACPASLAIAVANAGGLGGCGALLMQPDAIHKWVSDVRAGTNGCFQLNLWIEPFDQAAITKHLAKHHVACGCRLYVMVPRVVAHPSTCEIRKATASNSKGPATN